MEIKKSIDGSSIVVEVIGRLDTMTSPALEEFLKENIVGMDELVLDFGKLEYISSAGLRVILSNHKVMMKQGTMIIRNCSDEINEIFEVTGFTDILNIE